MVHVTGGVSIAIAQMQKINFDKWTPSTKAATLPKTNIAPENRLSQKEISIPTIHFQGLC